MRAVQALCVLYVQRTLLLGGRSAGPQRFIRTRPRTKIPAARAASRHPSATGAWLTVLVSVSQTRIITACPRRPSMAAQAAYAVNLGRSVRGGISAPIYVRGPV